MQNICNPLDVHENLDILNIRSNFIYDLGTVVLDNDSVKRNESGKHSFISPQVRPYDLKLDPFFVKGPTSVRVTTICCTVKSFCRERKKVLCLEFDTSELCRQNSSRVSSSTSAPSGRVVPLV